jgi:hypothetical protein
MENVTKLQTFAQYLALFAYLAMSLFAVVVAWNKRDRLESLNKEKGSGTEEIIGSGMSPADLPASFSRTVGLAGAISLGSFMWCIGLMLLVGHPLLGAEGFSETLKNFILASSALFAPYAFNQLSSIFPAPSVSAINAAANAASTAAAVRSDLKSPIPPPSHL